MKFSKFLNLTAFLQKANKIPSIAKKFAQFEMKCKRVRIETNECVQLLLTLADALMETPQNDPFSNYHQAISYLNDPRPKREFAHENDFAHGFLDGFDILNHFFNNRRVIPLSEFSIEQIKCTLSVLLSIQDVLQRTRAVSLFFAVLSSPKYTANRLWHKQLSKDEFEDMLGKVSDYVHQHSNPPSTHDSEVDEEKEDEEEEEEEEESKLGSDDNEKSGNKTPSSDAENHSPDRSSVINHGIDSFTGWGITNPCNKIPFL